MPKKNGRPTKMTDAVVKKLIYAFELGSSDAEACSHAGISRTTLFNYEEENEGFRDNKAVLKSNVIFLARQVLYNALVKDKDVATAHKMIDRKEGSKLALSGLDGGPMVTKTVIEFVSPES